MITTVLSLFTLSSALGEAPPQIISAHKTYAECHNAKQNLLYEKWKEMQKNTTFPACLRVVFEDAGMEHVKEEKKGSGE
jgi:hypothetical protein